MIKHDGKMANVTFAKVNGTKRLLRDEMVERTLLNHMGLSSNLCSKPSCATLDKSLTLFNS